MMAPNKCSHNTISNSPVDRSSEISIRLLNENIPINQQPKFLGVTFDNRLNFKTHFENVVSSCQNRLNIIKILSCKTWKLRPDTLMNIYKSLIRSIMEYSSILYPLISQRSFKKLEIIQNKAIRISYKCGWRENTSELLAMAKLDDLKQRFDELNSRYLEKCLLSNELIIELTQNFKDFRSRPGSEKSILAKYFEDIDLLL